MIRIQDFGEIAYGGAVTLTSWWDNKRIEQGKIGTKDVLKKASFYTYLGVGLGATLISVFGWMRRYEVWAEKISTGFFYDLPRFVYDMNKTLSAAGRGSESAAVREAQRILSNRTVASRQLVEGRVVSRTYEPEFQKASLT